MERCGVSNRVRHWEDGSTKAGLSCLRPVVNTKFVFSIADSENRVAGGSDRHTADAGGDFRVTFKST